MNVNMEEEEYKEFMEFQKWKRLRSKVQQSPISSNQFADSTSMYSEMTYPKQKNFNHNSQSTKLPNNQSKSTLGIDLRQNNCSETSEDFSRSESVYQKPNTMAHNNPPQKEFQQGMNPYAKQDCPNDFYGYSNNYQASQNQHSLDQRTTRESWTNQS